MFRVVTRALLHYHAQLQALPTRYDTCPRECVAPEADRDHGCPACPFTRAHDAFRRGATEEMAAAVKRLYADRPPPSLWSLDDLVKDFNFANSLLVEHGDRTPDGITFLTAQQIEVIREEKYLRRRLEDEEREEEK